MECQEVSERVLRTKWEGNMGRPTWVSGAGMPRQQVRESEKREALYFQLKWTNLIKPLPVTGLLHVSGSMLHKYAWFI